MTWWRSGQTPNVEDVATLTGEALFWTAVVFSSSLGTSTGDYLASDQGMGAGLLPAALMLTVAMLMLPAVVAASDDCQRRSNSGPSRRERQGHR